MKMIFAVEQKGEPMNDLISRQAAIDALNEVSEHYTDKGREWHPHVNFMVEAIEALPSAQPEIDELQKEVDYWHEKCTSYEQTIVRLTESAQPERKKGKWIYTKKRLIRGGYVDASECSVCNKRIMPHLKPNFCPNCGAEMEDSDA